MTKPSLYLAGPITGTTYNGCVDWREEVKSQLFPDITCFSPMRGKQYLSKETSISDSYEETLLSSQRGIFARDSFDCQRCDAVFVNFLGATRVSIGTVMEISWAWLLHKPIILVMEPNNIHTHSMLREACPFQVSTLEEGIHLTRVLLLPGT